MAKTSTQQRLLYCFVAAAVIAILIATSLAYLRSHADRFAPLKSLDTWQQADDQLGHPIGDDNISKFDSRFIQLGAFERTIIPSAIRLAHPMGSNHGALCYNAQPFWSDNQKRGGRHTGDDYNGIGGMNTDLGDPVYAAANGTVVYRGQPSKGWGNTLIIAHRAQDGAILQLMYSHLQDSNVTPGELISIGQQIGTVGTANLTYPAHLHLELRNTTGVWIGRGYVKQDTEHLSPEQEIAKSLQKSPELLYQSPLQLAKQERLKQARDDIEIINISK